jgi:diguanylate cyclase (GGDEF)-like protein
VLSDRVAGPREIIQRLEPAIRDALGVETVTLLPIEEPSGQLWRSSPTDSWPIPEVRLRELAQERSYLLHVRDFSRLDSRIKAVPRSGSALYVGMGDEAGRWSAVLEARDERVNAFDRERVHLAVLLAGHFETLLANAVRLQSFMFFDYLTGLHNRSYFDDQLDKMVSSALRHAVRFALCIVDVDDFKNFNTLYGYEGGDLVLATVACVLKAAVRTTDSIARYGGEEFAVLLAAPVDGDEAEVIAERLRSAVESEPFQVESLDGRLVPEKITVSVGGALFPEHGPGAKELWTAANRMLLQAKGEGKNCVRLARKPPWNEEQQGS